MSHDWSLLNCCRYCRQPPLVELRERLARAGGLGPLGFRRLGRARAFEVMAVIGRLPKRVTYPGYVQRPPFQRYGASQDINEPGCLAVVLAHRYPRCDFSESRVRFLAIRPDPFQRLGAPYERSPGIEELVPHYS